MKGMQERIAEEISYCFTYEKGSSCAGASGRKMKEVCVWCPNFERSGQNGNRDCGEHLRDGHRTRGADPEQPEGNTNGRGGEREDTDKAGQPDHRGE